MRNSLDPYGGADTLVDKLIGTAYDVVLAVRMALPELLKIAADIKGSFTVRGTSGGLNETVVLAMPAGVSHLRVVTTSVILADTLGNIYGTDTGYFSAKILDGMLNVIVLDQAAAHLSIRWYVTYEE